MNAFEPQPSTASVDDAAIIHASWTDPDRFWEIFVRHRDAMFRFAAIRVGPDHAEDIVSETFAVAFDRRARYDITAVSARPWLYGITTKRLLKHRETERRWLERALLEPPSVAEASFSLADARVDAGRMGPGLARALLELSPIQRSVLLLHAVSSMSDQQIADALGIRIGTVKSHLSRGRARLRQLLTTEEVHHV